MTDAQTGTPNALRAEPAPSDVVALDRLGDLATLVREVVEQGRPRVITEDGKPVAAIVDTLTYERLQAVAMRQLRDDLLASATEAKSGQVLSHEEVMREVREELAGELSAELLEQLGSA